VKEQGLRDQGLKDWGLQQMQKVAWRQDTDSLIYPNRQQVFIARNDDACACQRRAFKDHIVIGIAANATKLA